MKLLKFPVLAMLAVSTLITSCNDDGDWNGYNEVDEVFTFDQASATYSFTPANLQDSIIVTLTRNNVGDEKFLPITAEFESDALSGPSSVYFEKGSNQADYVIKINNLGIGETASATLAFADSVSVSGTSTCEVSVKLDYTWVSAGSCQMYSQWAQNSSAVRIPIEYAVEGNGLYRLNSPYFYLEPNYCPAEGYHVQFYLDENYNALGLDQITFIGESLASANDAVLVWFANGNYNCSFQNSGSTFLINGVIGYVTASGIGLQAYEQLYFLWDNGYPGAQ